MDISEALSVSVKVLGDWRVDFMALAAIVAWAALRYVGSVYNRRAGTRPRPPPSVSSVGSSGGKPAKARRGAAKRGRDEGVEDDSDSGMIE